MRSLEWQTKNAQLYFSLQKQPSLLFFVRRKTSIVADFFYAVAKIWMYWYLRIQEYSFIGLTPRLKC